jgi:predicted molibdopterin-dependent oxidoreductase YjgC
VRALAEHAEHVLVFAMYRRGLPEWADVVLPATSYLERDGTTMNLEGRLQRQRRAVIPPATDETAVIAELGRRLGVAIPASVPELFAELSERVYGGLDYGAVDEHSELPGRIPAGAAGARNGSAVEKAPGAGLRLVPYRALFSGPAVERVPELQFQRPAAEVTLAARDAAARGIATGDELTLSSNGTSVRLRARVSARLAPGHALVADDHCRGLGRYVEALADGGQA